VVGLALEGLLLAASRALEAVVAVVVVAMVKGVVLVWELLVAAVFYVG
jgi:hypothetical protein